MKANRCPNRCPICGRLLDVGETCYHDENRHRPRPIKLSLLKSLLRNTNTEYLRLIDLEKKLSHFLPDDAPEVLQIVLAVGNAYKSVLLLEAQVQNHPRYKSSI